MVYDEIASQIDLPTTLLSLMGISGYVPMLGRDLTQKPKDLPGRAILQFYKYQAYLTGNQMIILQPEKKIDQFEYRQETLLPVKTDRTLADTALAHALWASWTYQKQLYRSAPELLSFSNNEPISKLSKSVTPAKACVQKGAKILDSATLHCESGLHRNGNNVLLKLALLKKILSTEIQ